MMKQEIARLIDEKAEQLASGAKRRRNTAAVGGGLIAGLFTMVALIAFNASASTVVAVVMFTVIALLAVPYVLTYGGAFRVRRLIRANRLIEAKKLSQQTMAQSLRFYPYSALYFVATLQLDLMLRQAAYHEVEALSRLLRGAIERYPYFRLAKKRLLPLFDNYEGLAYLGLSEYESARKLFSECLASATRMNKPVFLNNIAVCDLQTERFDDAYAGFSQAIAATPAMMRNHFLLPRLYPNLARACVKLGKLEEAGDLLRLSEEYFEKNAEDNTLRAGFYKSLGLLKAARGHFEEAEQHLRSAIALQHQVDDLHPSLQDSRLELAVLLEKMGKETEAKSLRNLVAENILKLQLRLENASDELEGALLSGSHPILLLSK